MSGNNGSLRNEVKVNNLNLLFNKTYYSEIGEAGFNDSLKETNGAIFATTFYADRDYKPIPVELAPNKFLMKTSYPGLLVGTGYAHGSGLEGANDDINSGFSLDYVTGQPYIPASSVKGLLRSAFEHPDLIKELIKKPLEELDFKELENKIFGDEKTKEKGDDVFFDAVIRSSCRGDKRILGSDYITPHKEETKNPIPILIMKLLPDVVIEFSFKLSDTDINGVTVSAQDKSELFCEIFEVLGAGAKTNVGYGVLSKVEKDSVLEKDPVIERNGVKTQTQNSKDNQNKSKKGNPKASKNDQENYHSTPFNGGQTARIKEVCDGFCIVELLCNNAKAKVELKPKKLKKGKKEKSLNKGDKIQVKITGKCNEDGIEWIAERK